MEGGGQTGSGKTHTITGPPHLVSTERQGCKVSPGRRVKEIQYLLLCKGKKLDQGPARDSEKKIAMRVTIEYRNIEVSIEHFN